MQPQAPDPFSPASLSPIAATPERRVTFTGSPDIITRTAHSDALIVRGTGFDVDMWQVTFTESPDSTPERRSGPARGVSATLAFSVVNHSCIAVLCWGAMCAAANNGGLRPGQAGGGRPRGGCA